MTTSGTYNTIKDFNVAQIIDEAFRRIRISPADITGEHMLSARISLDLMFVTWWNDGVQQFIIEREVQTLVGEDTDISFTTPDGTIDIIDMIYRNQTGQDIEIKPISREDYLYINDKTVHGQPLCYFVDKTTLPPVIYLWPVQNITGTSVVYNRLRQIQDVGAYTNTPDTTVTYKEAITAGLAARLAAKYGDDPLEVKLIKLANEAYNLATNSDRDRAPYVMKPRIGRRFYYGV